MARGARQSTRAAFATMAMVTGTMNQETARSRLLPAAVQSAPPSESPTYIGVVAAQIPLAINQRTPTPSHQRTSRPLTVLPLWTLGVPLKAAQLLRRLSQIQAASAVGCVLSPPDQPVASQ